MVTFSLAMVRIARFGSNADLGAADDGRVHLQLAVRVPVEDRDAVAALQAHAEQTGGQPVHALAELAVTEAQRAIDDGEALRVQRDRALQDVV